MGVGFIGLGIMGSRMAANLARAGYELPVFNRTREKAEAWAAEHGATVADRPREVAERADVVITMVVDGAQVEEMLLGEDGAVDGRARRHAVRRHVDDRAGRRAPHRRRARASAGHGFVDAPVTGSSPKAEDGTLTIMCGGTDEDLERARPLFEAMGEKIVHAGAVGQGQAVKVISNSVSATNCATLAQALVVGRRAGVDLDALLEVMGAGSANSTMLQLKGSRCWSTTSRRCSSSSTCSRTSACASTRRARTARRSRSRRSAARALRRWRGPRPRRAGLRGGARGRRGDGRHTRVTSHWKPEWNRFSGIGPIASNGSICRGIMRFRDFVHSM